MCHSDSIPNRPQLLSDFIFKLVRLLEHFRKLSGQALHLFVKRFAVVLLFLNADIATGREDIILLGDLLCCCHSRKALDFF